MDLTQITLHPVEPPDHFADIATLMSTDQTETVTAQSLEKWFRKEQEYGSRFTAALTPDGRLVGFNAIYRDNLNYDRLYGFYLNVENESRRQGLGNLLYENLLQQAEEFGALTLRTRVRDNQEEGLQFATRRGFALKKHSIEMMFDLTRWDEQHYQQILQSLQTGGFRFTNMAELGDTPDARRKLYALNNGAAADDPTSDGVPPWPSFEEFEKHVCNSYWYHPDGQIVAIDTQNGEWAAMSAITIFDSADHAYNLFTGTNARYRGRKLAQAVKSLALRKAREWGVEIVRTSHDSENEAMIAIDTRLGYVRTPGTYIMMKELGG